MHRFIDQMTSGKKQPRLLPFLFSLFGIIFGLILLRDDYTEFGLSFNSVLGVLMGVSLSLILCFSVVRDWNKKITKKQKIKIPFWVIVLLIVLIAATISLPSGLLKTSLRSFLFFSSAVLLFFLSVLGMIVTLFKKD